jgi:hypothetical protein
MNVADLKDTLEQARELLEQKDYEQAHQVLLTVKDDPTAQKWMQQLYDRNLVTPPADYVPPAAPPAASASSSAASAQAQASEYMAKAQDFIKNLSPSQVRMGVGGFTAFIGLLMFIGFFRDGWYAGGGNSKSAWGVFINSDDLNTSIFDYFLILIPVFAIMAILFGLRYGFNDRIANTPVAQYLPSPAKALVWLAIVFFIAMIFPFIWSIFAADTITQTIEIEGLDDITETFPISGLRDTGHQTMYGLLGLLAAGFGLFYARQDPEQKAAMQGVMGDMRGLGNKMKDSASKGMDRARDAVKKDDDKPSEPPPGE